MRAGDTSVPTEGREPAIKNQPSLVNRAIVSCLYVPLFLCVIGFLWGLIILTSITTVKTLSPPWSRIQVPVTFDLRTETGIMKLDLTSVPELQSQAASKGQVHYVMEGDEVDISLKLAMRIGDVDFVAIFFTMNLESDSGKQLRSSSTSTSFSDPYWTLRDTTVGRFLLTLLRRHKKRKIAVKMIERYKETDLESLRIVHATMKAEYGDQLPPILESSLEIRKHLSLAKRCMVLLRPPAAICWLGSLFGWMLISVCSVSAFLFYKCIQRLSRNVEHDQPESASRDELIAGTDAPVAFSTAEKPAHGPRRRRGISESHTD